MVRSTAGSASVSSMKLSVDDDTLVACDADEL